MGQAGPSLCVAPVCEKERQEIADAAICSVKAKGNSVTIPGILRMLHTEHRCTSKEQFLPKDQSMQAGTAGSTWKGPQSLHQNLKQNIEGLRFGKSGPESTNLRMQRKDKKQTRATLLKPRVLSAQFITKKEQLEGQDAQVRLAGRGRHRKSKGKLLMDVFEHFGDFHLRTSKTESLACKSEMVLGTLLKLWARDLGT